MAKTDEVQEEAFADVSEEQIDNELAAEKIAVNAAPNVNAILENLDLDRLIEARVAEAVAKVTQNPGNPIVDATEREQKAIRPDRYLKHYRCDVAPDLNVTARNYNAAEDALEGVIKGRRIIFRRGHFFATEQWQVDQIEWMMRHSSLDPGGTVVIGGNPTIYEDDGKDLAKCAYCDEVFVVGSNSFKSHLRATHGVSI